MIDAALKTVEYPALDLTLLEQEDWNSSMKLYYALIDGGNLFFSSDKKFKANYLHHIIIDSNGNIFKIIGKHSFSKWRRFLPFASLGYVLFEYQEKSMSLEEIRTLLLKWVEDLDNEKLKKEWKNQLLKAHSYEELYLS